MTTQKDSPFAAMQAIGKTISLYTSILQVVEWDQETYMPSKAIDVRSDQTELLSGFIHKQKTSASFKKALAKLCDLKTGEILQKDLPLAEKAAVRLWHKHLKEDSKIPASFVKLWAKTSSASLHAWDQAKKTADFKLFAPHLQKMVSLCQKKAKLLGYKEHPYDALLDLYEPGMTVSKLTPLFAELKTSLMQILQNIQKANKTPLITLPKSFDPEVQMRLGKELLKALGFSEEISRLDLSSHPFCIGIHPTDTRMTTRIFKDNLVSHIFSVLHESGHGLYNTQLPLEFYGTPVCEPLSYGVDESQSRLWETLIGRNKPFWKFFYPVLQKTFPSELGSIQLQDFYRAVNKVEPSFIRVEADEVTYCLHIILRFEIEKGLIEGSLKVKDIPSVWNQKMQESFGITPSNDREGCLQDIHWAMGSLGYFPTYALGNLLAAQLYDTMKQAMPDVEKQIEEGRFTNIRSWLKENIHQKGKIYETEELIQAVTKSPLSSKAYIRYLQNKYGQLYA